MTCQILSCFEGTKVTYYEDCADSIIDGSTAEVARTQPEVLPHQILYFFIMTKGAGRRTYYRRSLVYVYAHIYLARGYADHPEDEHIHHTITQTNRPLENFYYYEGMLTPQYLLFFLPLHPSPRH